MLATAATSSSCWHQPRFGICAKQLQQNHICCPALVPSSVLRHCADSSQVLALLLTSKLHNNTSSLGAQVAPWHSNSAVPNTMKSHKPYLQCKTALCHLRPLAPQKPLARCLAQLRKHITALLHSFYGHESCSCACTELQNMMSKSLHMHFRKPAP